MRGFSGDEDLVSWSAFAVLIVVIVLGLIGLAGLYEFGTAFSRVSISQAEPKQITQTTSIFKIWASERTWDASQVSSLYWKSAGGAGKRAGANTKFICLELVTKKGEEIKLQCFSRNDKWTEQYLSLRQQVDEFPLNADRLEQRSEHF